MARIISPSKVKAPLVMTCKYCEAVVEFEFKEMSAHTDGSHNEYYQGRCPACDRCINFHGEWPTDGTVTSIHLCT